MGESVMKRPEPNRGGADWRVQRERAAWRIGRRGACLIVLSAVFGLYGSVILGDARHIDLESTRSTLALMSNILPARAWGMVWITAAVIAFAQSLIPRTHTANGARSAFASLTFVSGVWGAGTIAADILYGGLAVRPLLIGSVWLSVSALTIIIAGWQEDPRRYRRPRRSGRPGHDGAGGGQ